MPLWYDFISLVFPRTCEACGNTLHKHEQYICNYCLVHLPRTDFHLHLENPVARLFWGRVRLRYATAMLYFHKGNRVQQLIHKLKYKGRQEIGVHLGRMYGQQLRQSPAFSTAEVVIPVPLHPAKQRKRGYNQSEAFARGLAQAMDIRLDTRSLIRKTATTTQTRKSRFLRWENVKEVFEVHPSESLSGKHILLVDDVITTGATLEACAQELLQCEQATVSIATIACAIK